MAKSPTKSVLRFSCKDDVLLLREAVASALDFDAIAEKVSCAIKKEVSRRTAKERIERMIKQYREDDRANLRKSGTEEEYEEKENLLQELIEIQRDAKEKEEAKKKKKNKEEEKKVNQGLTIREKALETFKRKHEDGAEAATTSTSTKKRKSKEHDLSNFLDKVAAQKERELELETRRLAIREKELEMGKQERHELINALVKLSDRFEKM